MSVHCIIDIDTTIANNDHRAILLKRKCVECGTEIGSEHRAVCPSCGCEKSHAPQESWDQFLRPDLMLLDTPQPHAREVIDFMRERGYKITFLTGRNEKYKDVTRKWLSDHMNLQHREELIMRPQTQDNVPASQMKEIEFLKYMGRHHKYADQYMFFEDDRHVLGTWRKYGLVFLCPEAWQYLNPEVRITGEMAWNR